jgi:hypothetical protein
MRRMWALILSSFFQITAVMDRNQLYLESLRSGLVLAINNIRNGWVIVVVVFGHLCAIHE